MNLVSSIPRSFSIRPWRSVRSLVAALAYASLCAAVSGADAANAKPASPPKKTAVPKLAGDVKVDGELNEPVWQKAATLKPFFKNDGSGRERENTEVKIWYDDTALYLAWICQDADVQATFTQRDSKFWEEEVAEFFVTPKDLSRYFELQWNPLGGVFDAIIENDLDQQGVSKNFRGDWNFTAKGMKSAVKLKGTPNNSADKDEFWQVEAVIPFADLSATPKPGDIWRANFYRFNRAKDQPVEQLSWSPTLLPSFHQPSRFGYLEFGK